VIGTLTKRKHESLVIEVTQRCNHDCPHCYNAWKNDCPYPMGELPTDETLRLMGKLLDESGADLVSLTGGEPLLRDDILDICKFIADRGVAMNMITNGSLLTAGMIEKLIPFHMGFFELPLLSADRAIHDRMSGSEGAFDKTTMAIAELKAAQQPVVAVFVATKLNLSGWREAAELAIALGVDGLMFNRFNPGGCGYKNFDMLQSDPEELQTALDIAEEISKEYDLSISCSIAMPPCLFDTEKYERLGFGFCAAGTDRAYYTMDPMGNIRPCNHSPTILGNIGDTGFWEMVDGPIMKNFFDARPAFCGGCALEDECLGGCKAAAEACTGDINGLDPFLAAYKDRVVKRQ
jgi:radical SAM protein with 4Fe4S-binding SPASM domain